MKLVYFESRKIPHIVEEFYELTFSNEAIPFRSTILPLEYTNLTFIAQGNQSSVLKKIKTPLEGLFISGQFFRSYEFNATSESKSFGISFHPTALYKILQTDLSKFENKHIPLQTINKQFFDAILPILSTQNSSKKITQKLILFFKNYPLKTDKSTDNIDKAIEIIKIKEGLLTINDILDELLISQKTLETQFKTIVGLTPGKYIRKYRFLKLMKKYQHHEINLKDLIFMYNYYDHSHFTKDFKLFMKQSPKTYFKNEHPLLDEYLKK